MISLMASSMRHARRARTPTSDTTSGSGQREDRLPEIAKAALAYRAQGWSLVPIEPRGKRPLVRWERFQERAPSEAEIVAWFERWPEANVGIVTGGVSGLVVVD